MNSKSYLQSKKKLPVISLFYLNKFCILFYRFIIKYFSRNRDIKDNVRGHLPGLVYCLNFYKSDKDKSYLRKIEKGFDHP